MGDVCAGCEGWHAGSEWTGDAEVVQEEECVDMKSIYMVHGMELDIRVGGIGYWLESCNITSFDWR